MENIRRTHTIEILDSKEHLDLYQKFHPKHTPIGWMKETWYNGSITRLIVKMKPGYRAFTPYGCARDCGDHYIIARYSGYDRVDKKTLEVTTDVEDR